MFPKFRCFWVLVPDSPVKASLHIHTPYLQGANCSTTPSCQKSGGNDTELCIAGVTLIDIKCVVHRTHNSTIIFEYFDRNFTENDSMFKGK